MMGNKVYLRDRQKLPTLPLKSSGSSPCLLADTDTESDGESAPPGEKLAKD